MWAFNFEKIRARTPDNPRRYKFGECVFFSAGGGSATLAPNSSLTSIGVFPARTASPVGENLNRAPRLINDDQVCTHREVCPQERQSGRRGVRPTFLGIDTDIARSLIDEGKHVCQLPCGSHPAMPHW